MAAIVSELNDMGFCLPNFKNSNFSFMKGLAAGKDKRLSNGKRKAVLIIDGLGYDTLKRAIDNDKQLSDFVDRNHMEKISTIFPSFTPSVMISMDTGLDVGQHGIIGDFFSKFLGSVVNPFKLSWFPSTEEIKGNAPKIMPEPFTLEKLKRRYGGFVYMMRENVLGKEIKSDFVKNVEVVPHTGNEDLFVHIERELKNKRTDFIYAYTDALDHFSHAYSKNGKETIRLVDRLFRDIMRLEDSLKKSNTELFIFSDHGQIVRGNNDDISIGWKDSLMGMLQMPVLGNGRSFAMRIEDGKIKKVEDYFAKKYNKNVAIFDSKELIDAGIFGERNVSDFARYNFGDRIGIAKGNTSFSFVSYNTEVYKSQNPSIRRNSGTHGGMSKEEMEIPLLRIG